MLGRARIKEGGNICGLKALSLWHPQLTSKAFTLEFTLKGLHCGDNARPDGPQGLAMVAAGLCCSIGPRCENVQTQTRVQLRLCPSILFKLGQS